MSGSYLVTTSRSGWLSHLLFFYRPPEKFKLSLPVGIGLLEIRESGF
jgi:hypothetical protein